VLDDSHLLNHEKLCVYNALRILTGENELLVEKDVPFMVSSLELSPQGKITSLLSQRGLCDEPNFLGGMRVDRHEGLINNNGVVVEQSDDQVFGKVFDTAAVAANLTYMNMVPPEISVLEAANLGFADGVLWLRVEDNPNNIVHSGFLIASYDEPETEKRKQVEGMPTLCASKNGLLDNRYHPEVSLFGHKYYALLDTGAMHSFLSPEIVEIYSIPVKTMTGKIQLANKSVVE
jgi:hypothetical protein